MKKLFILLAFIQFNLVNAQEPWVFQYYFDHAFQILESYDGGTVMLAVEEGQAHTGKVIKVNKLGEVLWIPIPS
jgi:hypothetical protein